MEKKKKISKPKYIKQTITIGDTYERYLQETPEEDQVDKSSYVALCRAFNRLMMDRVIKGDKIALPAKLGTLEVKGFKENFDIENGGIIRGLSPNWKATKELWEREPQTKIDGKIIYNTNEHSDGVRYKYLWSKRNCHIRNHALYSLRITRAMKRTLSLLIQNGAEYQSK